MDSETVRAGTGQGQCTFRTMVDSSEGNSFLALRREEEKDIKIAAITVDLTMLSQMFPQMQKQIWLCPAVSKDWIPRDSTSRYLKGVACDPIFHRPAKRTVGGPIL